MAKPAMALAVFVIAAGLAGAVQAQQSDPVAEIVQLWLGSGHADVQSPSFSHWNAEGAIPPNCALCHSGDGFKAFYGLDGSEPGPIAHPVPLGGVVDCGTCHDGDAMALAAVAFPSGIEIENPGSTGTCLTCHQGRQSGLAVERAVSGMDDNTVNPELAFINIHYANAAATLYGSEVRGGYEYPGRDYMGRFTHIPPFSTCVDCHDAHSLEVRVETCIGCHQTDDLHAIRTSTGDYDGLGDPSRGIHAEIETLKTALSDAIAHYAETVSGTPIVYLDRNPYFFIAGTEPAERYNAFTPTLLRAAYNYQFVTKDKGAWSHNPHYAIQLLHDSIESLVLVSGQEIMMGERP